MLRGGDRSNKWHVARELDTCRALNAGQTSAVRQARLVRRRAHLFASQSEERDSGLSQHGGVVARMALISTCELLPRRPKGRSGIRRGKLCAIVQSGHELRPALTISNLARHLRNAARDRRGVRRGALSCQCSRLSTHFGSDFLRWCVVSRSFTETRKPSVR